MATTLWRVLPWNPGASPGEPFSREHLPPQSGLGRFDLPSSAGASAWYFAESPEHAAAEKVQHLRNRRLYDDFLFERGHRLALCSVELEEDLRLPDLCDPSELVRRRIAPDRLAFRNRSVTQAIAHSLHLDPRVAGFRWWSALFGEWHTAVLFSDRLPVRGLTFSAATPLQLATPAVVTASAALGIEIAD